MNEAVSERQPYLWGPRVKRAIVLGLRGSQLALLGVAFGLILTLFLLPLGISFAFIPIIAVTALALVFVPIKRRTADLWVIVLFQYATRLALGQRVWTSRGHLAGHTIDDEREVAAPQDLPPGLQGVQILAASVEGLPTQLGVIQDGRCYVAALSVQGPGFILMDPADQSRLADGWGSVVGPIGIADSIVSRIQWVERTVPQNPAALRNFACEKIVELRDCQTDEQVEAVLASLPEDRQRILSSYWEGIQRGGPVSQHHECLVALMIDARRPSIARQLKRIGNGDLDAGACEAMIRQIGSLAESLTQIDVTVDGMLTPRLLSEFIRAGYTPGIRERRALLEQAGAEEGEHVANFGPQAIQEGPNYLRTDGMVHRVYHVAEFPRSPVGADFMAPLLLKTKAQRTVSMTIEPVPTVQAFRRVDRTNFDRTMTAEARSKAGKVQGFRSRSEDDKIQRLGQQLSAGHVNVRLSTYLTVSAPSLEELEWACADAEIQAAQSRLEMEVMWAQQLVGFTYGLPLARGL